MKCIPAIFSLFVFNLSLPLNAAVKPVAPDTLAAWIANGPPFDFILIDVRDSTTTEILSTGVIATGQCRPYNFSYNRGVFAALIPQLPKQIPYVLYCRSGVRSGNAAAKLDSAGFSSVYSMTGGFNNWHGPVDSVSRVRPVTDLPARSMVKNSTNAMVQRKAAFNTAIVSFRGNCLFVNSVLPPGHTVRLFNSAGTCILAASDPFSVQPRYSLQRTFGPGAYFVRLADHSKSHSLIKIIISH
jgi:rhodanese-related sulfurtransferase